MPRGDELVRILEADVLTAGTLKGCSHEPPVEAPELSRRRALAAYGPAPRFTVTTHRSIGGVPVDPEAFPSRPPLRLR
jgi:hypothetical protein